MVGIIYGIPQKVDKKDKKILKALFQDGRMSIADLAKKTNLRRDSIARRLKRLRKDKVITGFVPIINPPSLGYSNIAIVLLRLKTKTDREKKTFLNKLVANKYIVHISRLIGKFDFYCSIVYRDTNHLNEIIKDIRTYVPDLVEDFELYQVVDDPKYEKMDDLL